MTHRGPEVLARGPGGPGTRRASARSPAAQAPMTSSERPAVVGLPGPGEMITPSKPVRSTSPDGIGGHLVVADHTGVRHPSAADSPRSCRRSCRSCRSRGSGRARRSAPSAAEAVDSLTGAAVPIVPVPVPVPVVPSSSLPVHAAVPVALAVPRGLVGRRLAGLVRGAPSSAPRSGFRLRFLGGFVVGSGWAHSVGSVGLLGGFRGRVLGGCRGLLRAAGDDDVQCGPLARPTSLASGSVRMTCPSGTLSESSRGLGGPEARLP